MNWKAKIIPICKWTALLLAGLLLLLGLLFGLAQTRMGKRYLAARLASWLSAGPDVRVEMGRIEGLVPINVWLDRLAVSDADGEWFDVENVALHWSPAPLLRGRLHIEELSARNIRLDRLPPSRRDTKSREIVWPPKIPALPSMIVERFTIERLALGEAVFGKSAAFTIDGRITTPDLGVGIDAFLRVNRIEGPKALAEVTVALRGDPLALVLHARAEEPDGALLAAALGSETPGPVTMELHGDGPIEDWKGRLTASAVSLGTVEADIFLEARRETTLKAEGKMRIAHALLPKGTEPLLEHENRFSLDLVFQRDHALTIDHLNLETPQARLRLKGATVTRENRPKGDFVIELDDLSLLETLVDAKLAGRLDVKGSLSGSLNKPQVAVSLGLDEARVFDLHISRFEGNLQLEPLGTLSSGFAGLRIQGKGSSSDLSYPSLKPFPEREVSWAMHLDVPAKGEFSIHKLEIAGKNLSLAASGRMDPISLQVLADADIRVRDLRPVAGYLGANFAGATRLKAGLRGNAKTRSFSARISGRLTDHQLDLATIAPLLGPEIDYAGTVGFVEGKELRVSDLHLSTQEAQFRGEAFLHTATQELKGRWHLAVPRLGVLSQILGRKVEGSLEMDGEIHGTLSAPELMVNATARDLLIKNMRFERMKTALRAEGLPTSPRGHVNLELTQAAHALHAVSDFSLEGHRLNLTSLSIKAVGTEVHGNLAFDLDGRVAEGTLQGGSRDLALLSSFLNQQIGGSAKFKAQLSPGKAGQDVTMDVDFEQLKSAYAQARILKLRANLRDVFQASKGTVEVKIKGLQRDDLTVDAMTVNASSTRQGVRFSSKAKGRFREGFEIEAKGALDTSPEGQRLELHRFQGKYERYPFELARPTVFERKSDRYNLDGLSLRIGEGNLQTSGSLSTEKVSLVVSFRKLPLEALRLAGTQDLVGFADGRLRMSGKPDLPEASLEIRLSGVRSLKETFEELPPATLRADGAIEEGRLHVALSLEGLAKKPVVASVQAPVNFSVSPFAFSLPQEGQLRGQLSAEADLARIPAFFHVEDQTLKGRVEIDLTLAGKPDAPAISGLGRIGRASYEDARTGTILRDIQLDIKGQHSKVLIHEARATDGGAGTVSAQGWLDLVPAQGFPFQVDVNLERATLVRQDAVTAEAGGKVRISGTLREAVLSGELTVGPAEIRIPDRLPPEIAEVEVVEINRPGQETQQQSAPQRGQGHKLRMDLQVESPGRVFVRGRGLDSEWKGALRIAGSAKDPAITGALSVVRGHYNLFGQRFSLAKGTISFDGTVPPSPNIDVTAENKRADITARVRLSGTPAALNISLESDPPLPSDEILARVLFGRSAANITPVQALRLAQAVNTLAGGGVGALDFMDRTRKIIGVDQLDVKQSDETQGGTSISIGKYLMDEVYVEVDKGVDTDSGKVTVEVEITPNISVESEAGMDARGGVGVFWKWDY